ncbi:hypothetical protein V8F06_000874 [Rhypophila decipiens]
MALLGRCRADTTQQIRNIPGGVLAPGQESASINHGGHLPRNNRLTDGGPAVIIFLFYVLGANHSIKLTLWWRKLCRMIGEFVSASYVRTLALVSPLFLFPQR